MIASRSEQLCTFLSTPSGWRATSRAIAFLPCWIPFLSTPSGWRATPVGRLLCFANSNFYPRPPGGGRQPVTQNQPMPFVISIHALRVEGDRYDPRPYSDHLQFLSTPSGWRATITYQLVTDSFDRISIHALRVEGDKGGYSVECQKNISIHALRVEGDDYGWRFQSADHKISIHALRVEGDSKNGQSFRLFLRKREKNLPL